MPLAIGHMADTFRHYRFFIVLQYHLFSSLITPSLVAIVIVMPLLAYFHWFSLQDIDYTLRWLLILLPLLLLLMIRFSLLIFSLHSYADCHCYTGHHCHNITPAPLRHWPQYYYCHFLSLRQMPFSLSWPLYATPADIFIEAAAGLIISPPRWSYTDIFSLRLLAQMPLHFHYYTYCHMPLRYWPLAGFRWWYTLASLIIVSID